MVVRQERDVPHGGCKCEGQQRSEGVVKHDDQFSTSGKQQREETLQKVPEFPVWTTCQKHVEYTKFPINLPIMESKKKI